MHQHMELMHVLSVFEDGPEHPNSYGSLSSSKKKIERGTGFGIRSSYIPPIHLCKKEVADHE